MRLLLHRRKAQRQHIVKHRQKGGWENQLHFLYKRSEEQRLICTITEWLGTRTSTTCFSCLCAFSNVTFIHGRKQWTQVAHSLTWLKALHQKRLWQASPVKGQLAPLASVTEIPGQVRNLKNKSNLTVSQKALGCCRLGVVSLLQGDDFNHQSMKKKKKHYYKLDSLKPDRGTMQSKAAMISWIIDWSVVTKCWSTILIID